MGQFTEDGTYYFNGHALAVEDTEGVNPKQQYGDRKVPLHLVPAPAMVSIAMGLKDGARKYGAFNWRTLTVEAETYLGAILRHLMAWQDGEDIDPDSGNPHLSHGLSGYPRGCTRERQRHRQPTTERGWSVGSREI